MDLLNTPVRPLYKNYLLAAFGSSLISSIYGIVDCAMVGQFQGPVGTAAMTVVSPVWNTIYSLGLLTGVGGSVLFSAERGRKNDGSEQQYFTLAAIATAVISAALWLVLMLFGDDLLTFFGADAALLPYSRQYFLPIAIVSPVYMLNQMLTCFVRADGRPALATASVLAGGIFNIFGDWFLIAHLGLGVLGAGISSAIGGCISFAVILSHLFSKKSTLRFVKVGGKLKKLTETAKTGASSFLIDIAMGVMTTLFNRQLMRYFGADALAAYGLTVNISTLVQCCAYSVGQASQPIMATAFGARRPERISEALRYCIISCGALALIWTAACTAAPSLFMNLFMDATPEVAAIAPGIIRKYAVSFLLLPFNVFCTYYFQSVMKAGTSFGISMARGVVVSGGMILLLPIIAGPGSIWYAMPITELIIFIAAAHYIRKYEKELAATLK